MSDILNSKNYHIENVDCIEHMATMPKHSVDMSIFSPPFPALYAYSGSNRDIGNSENFKGDAKLHLSFFYKQLARIIKPGRVVIVHIMQIPRLTPIVNRHCVRTRIRPRRRIYSHHATNI